MRWLLLAGLRTASENRKREKIIPGFFAGLVRHERYTIKRIQELHSHQSEGNISGLH